MIEFGQGNATAVAEKGEWPETKRAEFLWFRLHGNNLYLKSALEQWAVVESAKSQSRLSRRSERFFLNQDRDYGRILCLAESNQKQ